jgi:two-component system, OmpR family, sensor histidine kinase BaeS
MRPALLRRSFAAKLLAAQLLVVLAGSLTLLAVALSVGPILFHRHVRDALGVVPPDVARHLDAAFNQSTLVALGIAAAAAAITALCVSWFVSARVTQTIGTLAAASGEVARGAYGTRVSVVGEDEVGELARSFNEMATMLEQTEGRRRELLSDVAHELRTPLATIDGYIEAVADGVMQPEERIWHAIRTEVGRLTRLADDLQKVSRVEERQLDLCVSPVEPAAIIRAAVAAAAPSFDAKHVELGANVADGLPAVLIDADRIGEVLANLLENALRHTPPRGQVMVTATADSDHVELAVTDTGEGIEPSHLPRIFERFYRVSSARDRASGGSGIGLAIAKAIVEAHGGTIRAESAGVGRGTTLRLQLPLS